MFVFDDKTSLHKVFARYRRAVEPLFSGLFLDTSTTFRRSKDVDIAADEVTCKLCWIFLEFYPEAYVLSPAGHLIRLDVSTWLPPYEVYQPLNGLINIRSGLLQASDCHAPYYSPATCTELVKPFEGCPVFLADDDDLLFEDDFVWQNSLSPLATKHSAFLKDELEQWFEVRATELGVLRPPVVEVQYIDGDKESPDTMGLDSLALPDGHPILRSIVAHTNLNEQALRTSNETISLCAMEAFPEGKGSTTWFEVEAKVGYSRRSIVRALKALEQYEHWA